MNRHENKYDVVDTDSLSKENTSDALRPPEQKWRKPPSPAEICDLLGLKQDTYRISDEVSGRVETQVIVGTEYERDWDGDMQSYDIYKIVIKAVPTIFSDGILTIFQSASIEDVGREAIQHYGLTQDLVNQAQLELNHRTEVARIHHCNEVIKWAWNVRNLKPFDALPENVRLVLQRCINGDSTAAEGPQFPIPWDQAWKRACELSPQLEKQEILLNFGGRFRTGGWSDQREYLVIQEDGTLREPDQITFNNRSTDDGMKSWKLVTPSELALEWSKADTGSPHRFEVKKLPIDEITAQQRATATQFVHVVDARFKGQKSMSGRLSPNAGKGWDFEAARAELRATKIETVEMRAARAYPPKYLPLPKALVQKNPVIESSVQPPPSPESRRALIEADLSPEFITEMHSQLERVSALLFIIECSFTERPAASDKERTFYTRVGAMRKQWNNLLTDLLQKKKGAELRNDLHLLHEKIMRVMNEKAINEDRKNFGVEVQRKMTEWEAIPALVRENIDCIALLDEDLCTEHQLIENIRSRFLNNPWKQSIQNAIAVTVDDFMNNIPPVPTSGHSL